MVQRWPHLGHWAEMHRAAFHYSSRQAVLSRDTAIPFATIIHSIATPLTATHERQAWTKRRHAAVCSLSVEREFGAASGPYAPAVSPSHRLSHSPCPRTHPPCSVRNAHSHACRKGCLSPRVACVAFQVCRSPKEELLEIQLGTCYRPWGRSEVADVRDEAEAVLCQDV